MRLRLRLLTVIGCLLGIRSSANEKKRDVRDIEEHPIEDHPEFIERMETCSDCTPEQLAQVHLKCKDLVKDLIYVIDEYEYGLRNHNPDIPSLTRCERSQIACFTHPAWIKAAKCACSVCNHIWFYDEALHERFVLYFEKDHRCAGEIPNRMWKLEFCDFMNQTHRDEPTKACQEEKEQKAPREDTEEIIYFEDEIVLMPYADNAMNASSKDKAIMIWTFILALALSISMYFYTR